MTLTAARRRPAIAAALALIAGLLAFGTPLSASADVVGDGPGTISGTVTSTDATPLEGLYVSVSTSLGEGTSFSSYTYTDATGSYSFEGLPENHYNISTYAAGYEFPSPQSATISAAAPTATADFVLVPFAVGTGTIDGLITADGVPVANTSVTASNQATFQNVFTTTDENGAFEFSGLSNGQWQVHSYIGSAYQLLPPTFADLTEAAPAATVNLAFLSWPTGTAAIGGTLTDRDTGAAVAGVSIQIQGIDVAHSSNAITDESGAFSVEQLPEGTYSLTYWAVGYLRLDEQVLLVTDQTLTVDHALVPANAAISGHVKAKDGTPVAGIYVDAHNAAGNFGGAVTDENGDYVIDGLGAVEYSITVGGVGTPYKPKQKNVTAAANGGATANFTLKDRTTGALGGMIFAPGGVYYGETVCVKLYSSTKNKAIDEVATYGPEYGDGTYFFEKVKPGSYTVEFEDCDGDPAKAFDDVFLGGSSTYAGATFITVVAGEDSWENNLTFEPRATTSVISGHVEKGNGTPLAGLVVQATDGIASSASAITDANGNYTLTGLFTDQYTVTVGGIATPYKLKQKTVTTIVDATVTANFTLAKR